MSNLDAKIITKEFMALSPEWQDYYQHRFKWIAEAHPYQLPPQGDWWNIWLMLAGRGAGKTRTAAETIYDWAWTEPKTRWLVSAPTSGDVRQTCFEGDSGLLNVIPTSQIADYNKALHEIKLTNGSFIKGIPASEPERFRGPQFHGGWLDELAAWEYLQDSWDMLQFGIRLGTHTRLICTTTPKPKDLIIELVGREGDDVVITRASTYDNIKNLAPSFQKQILQYEGTKLGRQEIYAEIIDPEEGGIVKRDMFKLWPANKPFPRFEFIIQSYDCAYTEKTINDPTACIVFGVFKPDDAPMSVMVIDCWQERLQYPDLRPKVIEEYQSSYGADPEEDDVNYFGGKKVDLILVEDKAAGISLIQDLQRAHLPVRAYNPGRADKVQRLSIVSNIIARGRVWIPESSVRKGYVRDWAEGFVSQICSFPETTHDDYVDACVDASTQVMMKSGLSKRIDEIEIGDYVKTPQGFQEVSAVHKNGIKELWEVMAGDKMLLATADHKVFTQRGYVRVDSLIQGVDNVFFYNRRASWDLKAKAKLLLKPLSLMADVITDTLKATTLRIVNTLAEQDTGCTEMYGSFTMEQFPRAIMYTTLMETQPTMTSATYNAYQEQSITQNTLKSCVEETERQNSLHTSTESETKQKRGIHLKKEESGIVNMLINHYPKLGVSLESMRKLKSTVSGAVQKCYQRVVGRNSAQQDANQRSQVSDLVSLVRNTHIMQEVYDITVESEHCYYANGILVHNCTQALRYLRDAGFLDIDPPPVYDDDRDDFKRPKSNPYAS